MYVSVGGATNSALGPAGKRFIADFAATQAGGVVPSYTAAYAGQAAEACSTPSRAPTGRGHRGLEEKLFGVSVREGILGSFQINRNGDATTNPITILRVTGGRRASPTLLDDHVGTVLERVIKPPGELVADG